MTHSIDLPLLHGWHVTIFHPWAWLAVTIGALLVGGYALKLALTKIVSG